MAKQVTKSDRLKAMLQTPRGVALSCALVLGVFVGFCGIVHYRSQSRGEYLVWLADTVTPLVKDDWKTDVSSAMRQSEEIEKFLATYKEDSFSNIQWEAAYYEVAAMDSRVKASIAQELHRLVLEASPEEAKRQIDKLVDEVDEKSWCRKALRLAQEMLAERLGKSGIRHAE